MRVLLVVFTLLCVDERGTKWGVVCIRGPAGPLFFKGLKFEVRKKDFIG